MDRFARTVLGYHGCKSELADGLISGRIPISDWKPSENEYDWLGHGIYFWEHAPKRALEWSNGGSVVGAVIQFADCLDFSDTEYTDLLAEEFADTKAAYLASGETLPNNGRGTRRLDCLVINRMVRRLNGLGAGFQVVRSPFLEGNPAFEGSAILRESHVQLAVVDHSCIVGVFRPHLMRTEGGS